MVNQEDVYGCYLLFMYAGVFVGYFSHKVEAWMWRRELQRARIKRAQKRRRKLFAAE